MSTQNEQIENVTFQALAHPIRRTIIRLVQSRSQGITYTELLTDVGLPTGKLNYHLEQLKGIIEKDNSSNYVLTSFGKKAVEHLNLIEQRTNNEDQKYVQIAALTQKSSLQPIVKSFLIITIVMMGVFTGLWFYIGYITFMQGAPTVVYVLLPIGLAVGISLLVVAVYALLKTPAWLRRFEQRFFGEP
jgi:hypothetical protein